MTNRSFEQDRHQNRRARVPHCTRAWFAVIGLVGSVAACGHTAQLKGVELLAKGVSCDAGERPIFWDSGTCFLVSQSGFAIVEEVVYPPRTENDQSISEVCGSVVSTDFDPRYDPPADAQKARVNLAAGGFTVTMMINLPATT